MERIIKVIIKANIEKFYNECNKGFLCYIHNDNKGTSIYEISKDIAEKLKVGEIYTKYNIDSRVPIKNNVVYAYKVLEKIIDENNNTIIITQNSEIIEV